MIDRRIAESLIALEERVNRALTTGDEDEVEILGYGEISSVLAVDTPLGKFAAKRLPIFPSEQRFRTYSEIFETYLDRLAREGVNAVESVLYGLPRPDGGMVGYCIQPILDPEGFGPTVLARMAVTQGEAFFERILDCIVACCRDRSGIDAQLSNWGLYDDRLVYMDVTTPFFRDERGRELLDTEIFVASLPWAIRKPVLAFAVGSILDKWYNPRGAVLDLLGNLIKEQLGRWLPTFVAATNRRLGTDHGKPLTLREVERYYASDARLWGLLQSLRRADRFWQRKVRRRPYPFLLPGRISRNV